MKYILTFVLTIMVLASNPAFASTCSGDVEVKVNGLVCDFCARALEKVFSQHEEVSGIDVNLDTTIVTIQLKNDQSMEKELIQQLITDSGYAVVGMEKGCGDV